MQFSCRENSSCVTVSTFSRPNPPPVEFQEFADIFPMVPGWGNVCIPAAPGIWEQREQGRKELLQILQLLTWLP